MFSEAMIKTLLKTVDFEKLQQQLLSDPRIIDLMAMAKNLSEDFRAIKENQEKILAGQAEIIARLDNPRVTVNS